MKQTAYICILFVFAGVVTVSTIATPIVLSDGNKFLKDFVGPEFLGVLGVILAITLASSGQLHLAFNQIEEKFKARGLTKTRASVRSDTFALIFLFIAAVVVVIAKADLANSVWSQSLFNSAALFILLWNVLLLHSLTRTIFKIPPVFDEDGGEPPRDTGKKPKGPPA